MQRHLGDGKVDDEENKAIKSDFTPDDYANFEQSVYEAAVIPELWPKVFERLGNITETAGGSFACLNERCAHIVCAPALDGARLRILDGGYLERSGRALGVMKKGLMGVPRFLTEYDYCEDITDAESDPIVVDCFRKEGYG